LGGLLVPREWIGLLGLLPIIIGIRYWLNRNKIDEETAEGQAK
jgi:cadmium resistance protein CadD (predicted permease)